MYREFGKNKIKIKFASTLLYFSFLALLFVLLIVIAYTDREQVLALMWFFFAVGFSLYGLDSAKSDYINFPLVLTDYHLIGSYSFGKRRVYDLNKITWFKIYRRRLLFVHKSWVSVIYINGLESDEEQFLIDFLDTKVKENVRPN